MVNRALKLLVGLHERLWRTPAMDFMNLLRRAGMPPEVVNLANEAVQGCVVCRKYVRLPNRPQMRAGGSTYFGETLQIDIFHWEGHQFLHIIDEATRFKVCVQIEGQDSDSILGALFNNWMYYFGPPANLVLDQQMSLMGYDTGGECERLGITRRPKGTTQGHGANQHTGTGIAERHIQLLKHTMFKLKAELERQGLQPDPSDVAREAAMAHNQTINYGGVTPCMNVFGILPRGFYNPESPGILSVVGSLQTDVTTFERAVRIRQTALAQTAQAIIEDRIARANRTRPHQLDAAQLVAGTSEVEFFREVQGDPGWRGPALLLRLDQDEGVAVIQYQGKPYLVSLRHIRQYKGIYHMEVQSEQVDQALHCLMKFAEGLSDYKIYFFGWLRRQKDGKWYKVPKETPEIRNIMLWAERISKSMTRQTLHGIMIGKGLRSLKPPNNTTGAMILWIIGGKNYSVQQHQNSNHLKMKKVSAHLKEDTCVIYMYYYKPESLEPTSAAEHDESKMVDKKVHFPEDMDVEPENRKRDGPETRTVVLAPERKRQKIAWLKQERQQAQKEIQFLEDYFLDVTKNLMVILDYPDGWKCGYALLTQEAKNFMTKKYEQDKRNLPMLFSIEYKEDHHAYACLRTSQIFKVDQETNNITEEDLTANIWPDVDQADLNEIKQFVEEGCFRKIHNTQITSDMTVVDAIWVRKKKRYPDGSIRIKSRLCARGFLDSQKGLLTTRSTTATRLSQRLLVSLAAQDRQRDLESLDVGGAFLKGFNFKDIQKILRQQGSKLDPLISAFSIWSRE